MSGSAQLDHPRGKEWLADWDPENAETWDSKLAWRTLAVTTFALTLAFSTWFLASALAPILTNLGFVLSKGQLYWLAAMPGLAGGSLRLVWMFLPPILGTRKLVTSRRRCCVLPLHRVGHRHPEQPDALLGSDGTGLLRWHRRRGVQWVHAEHVVLLPAATAGDGARAAGRYRQLRRQPGPVPDAGRRGRRHHRRLSSLHRSGHRRPEGRLVPERGARVPAARRHCRDPGMDDAEERPGDCQLPSADGHLQQPGHVVDDVPLRHDLRHLRGL